MSTHKESKYKEGITLPLYTLALRSQPNFLHPVSVIDIRFVIPSVQQKKNKDSTNMPVTGCET